METAIKITHLQKHFGSVYAVEDISLEIRRGEIFGFLGPNGAGKTTTIAMLLGLIYPTAGEIEVLGESVTPTHTTALRRVGALVGARPAIIPYLSARDNLRLATRLHPGLNPQRLDETLACLRLEKDAHRKAGCFSTGMKQRLGLALALLHQPDLLILDEPTNGMDPAGMREVRDMLKDLAATGVTIFLSSHLLHEVEQVCQRVAVLNHGQIIAQGRVEDLLKSAALRSRAEEERQPTRQTLPDLESLFIQLTQEAI